MNELAKAFALCSSSDDAITIRDEVGLFQAIRAAFVKHTTTGGKSPEDVDTAIRQIVYNAVASYEVVDIFAAAGVENPDISILSDKFLADVRQLPQRHLALELLQKLINDEIKTRSHRNLVQSRSFARNAGTDNQKIPEPRHRNCPGDERINRTSKRNPGSGKARRKPGII